MKNNYPNFYSSVYCNTSDIINKFNKIDTGALAEARAISMGRIKLLKSDPFIFSKRVNWLADPVTKRKWRLFRGRPYLFAKEEYQDLKYVFELNRQQHLLALGKGYFFSKEITFKTEIYSQIHSWITSNPYLKTVNWLSPLELSIRIISWLWAVSFITRGRVDYLEQGEYGGVLESIYQQTEYISKNLQYRKYPNNHLIGEAATLVIVGIMFPHFSGARNWIDKGLEILGSQIINQVFSDGMDKEQALDYHRFVLDFYTHVVILCDRNNITLPVKFLHRLEKMYEALLYLVRPDGFGAMIGDDDNGRVATLSYDSGRFLLSALSTGAVLFNRGDFKFVAQNFHEESLWLLGLDGYREFEEITPEKPHSTSFYFQKTGLFVMRSRWGRESHYLSFDCGSQGMGTGGHGHADGLSFELSVFGRPLMIDPGTYVYNGSRQWRDYYRGTSAHNTVVVDGLNQSEYTEPYDNFGWSSKADCQTLASYTDEEFDFVTAYHDGYKRLPDPVRHTRSVLFVKNEYWIITDILDGQGEHCAEWPLHFVEDSSIQPMGENIFLIGGEEKGGILMSFICDREYNEEVFEGSYDPIQGWVSYRYGDKIKAPVLNISTESSLPVIANTVLLPFKHQRPYVKIRAIDQLHKQNNNLSTSIEININGAKDTYLSSNKKETRKFSGFETDAETILIRLDKEGVLWKCIVKNGSYLIHDGVEIFRMTKPMDFMVWQPVDSKMNIG